MHLIPQSCSSWRGKRSHLRSSGRNFTLLTSGGPAEFYEPQMRFFADGAKFHQRLIRGGNQVGKSFSCAFEANLHMTGQYPEMVEGPPVQETDPRLDRGRHGSACARRPSAPASPTSWVSSAPGRFPLLRLPASP